MKLNLGCGDDIKSGYVNVDIRKTHPSINVIDLSQLPWPFETETADEILMLDFLEHFPYRKTSIILMECHRILTPTGSIVVQVPDAEHLCHAISRDGYYLCNRCGCNMFTGHEMHDENEEVCQKCGQPADDIAVAAMMRLYGGQDYAGNFHHTCFTKRLLNLVTEKCGFDMIEDLETEHQTANWNFKQRFAKRDLW